MVELTAENFFSAASLEDWYREIQDIDIKDPWGWDWLNNQLFNTQYSYIKLGFLLTKIRNTCAWKYCGEKFHSFKQWCREIVHLPIWQVNQYIEASEIANYLKNHASGVLPKNLAQCMALKKAYHAEVEYYGERPQLDAAWANVTHHYKPHQITAGKIHATVDPDWQDNQPSKIERTIVDRAVQQAAKKGMTLNEYLGDLIGQDEYEETIDLNPTETQSDITDEQVAALDALDRQFKAIDKPVEPKKIIDRTVDSFDRLMDNLIGQFIPPVQRRVANE
jgi:hypothetical protein